MHNTYVNTYVNVLNIRYINIILEANYMFNISYYIIWQKISEILLIKAFILYIIICN